MIIVDGNEYNIPIISLDREAQFLDKYAERTGDGTLHRELIGVYYNYKLRLGTITDQAEYEALWKKLSEAREFHTVTVPDESGIPYTFVAYFSNVKDKLRKIKGVRNYFTGLTVNFIARVPANT